MKDSTNQQIKSVEKQKKLLMKKLMNWIRFEFNKREIAFHPLLLCISIKPGFQNRNSTLQSYPNQELWKAFQVFPNRELLAQIVERVTEKTFKFKLSQYKHDIILEFQNRIKNNFDFTNFYKDNKEMFQSTQLDSLISIQNAQIEEEKSAIEDQKTESEAKQLLRQMQLCNQKGSIAKLETLHYHKLQQLVEKLKTCNLKQQSNEMKLFNQELSVFLEKVEPQLEKKIKPNEDKKEQEKSCYSNQKDLPLDLTQIQNQSQILLLKQIKDEVLQMQPGLCLFFPSYETASPELKKKYELIETDFYKELFYIKTVDSENYNPKNILYIWRTFYEQFIRQTITMGPLIFTQNIKIE